jgi:hypothetical protein
VAKGNCVSAALKILRADRFDNLRNSDNFGIVYG